MDSKERVKRAVLHQRVDRTPTGLFGTHKEYELRLAEHVGAGSVEEMYHRLGVDIWHCSSGLAYVGKPLEKDGRKTNIWGSAGEPLFTEASSIDDVEAHLFPDAKDFDGTSLADEIAAHQGFFICGGINSAVFHHYLGICGQENALCLLKTRSDLAKTIIRRVTDFFVGYLRKVLEIGEGRIDMIENCNDFGTQRSMFISVDDFREFFKPQLKRLYDLTKEYGAVYMQHSCGAIGPIIGDFIEMGADLLNPIQVGAEGMVITELVAAYRGKIAFYGGIDTQHLLPQGPEAAIRAKVRELVELFGRDGGLILSGSQGLLNDIPFDHAVAMLDENRRISFA